jgi:excisionase family DNA binding protein
MNTTMPSDQPMLLTLNEAARRLSVCRRTLEREMAAGRFPATVRIGRAHRVPLAALQEYLNRITIPRALG